MRGPVGLLYGIDHPRLHLAQLRCIGRKIRKRLPAHFIHRKMRPKELPAIRDRRDVVQELERRHEKVALTDRNVVGIADAPYLPGALFFLVRRRYKTLRLPRQVHAGRRAEEELLPPCAQTLDAEAFNLTVPSANRVEIDVRGTRKRGMNVNPAMRLPVNEAARAGGIVRIGDIDVAGREHLGLRSHHLFRERRERMERLDG